ncbi:hypothetical protein RJ639_025421 [Escallonia herrerae]|uniref:F-box domain-containing protein n=1 Tax=Escallonia herrerae TaxID=1293975 RepID=A0AA88S3F1_9ASTE|nr:hypothetical protein RJ639_025421 [Escallonia herrerae]
MHKYLHLLSEGVLPEVSISCFTPAKYFLQKKRRQSEKLGNTQPVAEEETMDYHGSSISDLPLNIVVDILSRLLTKNIIHCRCVCWTFHNIISDKYFANLHLLRSPGCLVIHHFNVDGFTSAYTVNELKEKPYRNSLQRNQLMKFDLKEKFPNAKLHLVCSANGFLCLRESDTHAVCICNPVMREYVIPPPPEHTHWNIWKVDYAFGYCPVTGQYKVVCLSGVEPHEPATRSSSYKLEVEVYALGTRTWRNIGQFTHRLPGRSGVPVNGKIYWLVNAEGLRECPDSIWSFDFETELTEHVSLPPKFSEDVFSYISISLGVLRGCLCVCDNSSYSDLAIWVLNEGGTWTREVFIRKTSLRNWPFLDIVKPLAVLEDGDIVMFRAWENLFSYNFSKISSNHFNTCCKEVRVEGLQCCFDNHIGSCNPGTSDDDRSEFLVMAPRTASNQREGTWWFYCLLSVALLIIIVGPIVLYGEQILRRRCEHPRFTIDSVVSTPINASSSEITASWNVSFSLQNRFKHQSIFYEYVSASLFYGDMLLSNSTVPPFHQAEKNKTTKNLTFSARAVHVDELVGKALLAQRQNEARVLKFQVKVKGLVTLSPGIRCGTDYLMIVNCKNVRVGYSPSATVEIVIEAIKHAVKALRKRHLLEEGAHGPAFIALARPFASQLVVEVAESRASKALAVEKEAGLTKAQNELTQARDECSRLAALLEENTKGLDLHISENKDLKAQLEEMKQRANSAEAENRMLVDRWMLQKMQDAERLNENEEVRGHNLVTPSRT